MTLLDFVKLPLGQININNGNVIIHLPLSLFIALLITVLLGFSILCILFQQTCHFQIKVKLKEKEEEGIMDEQSKSVDNEEEEEDEGEEEDGGKEEEEDEEKEEKK